MKDNKILAQQEFIKKFWKEVVEEAAENIEVIFFNKDSLTGYCTCDFYRILGAPQLSFDSLDSFFKEIEFFSSEEYVCWEDVLSCSINYETGENDGDRDPEEVLNEIHDDDMEREYVRSCYDVARKKYAKEIEELTK